MRRSCWRFLGNAYPWLVAPTMLVLPMGQPTANPYSQVFLGFRALAVKLLIFVIMAALLAWAIGGTLWPRTTIRQIGDAVEVGGSRFAMVYQARTDGQGTFGLATFDENQNLLEVQPDVRETTPIWREALPVVAGKNPSASMACGFVMDDQWFVRVFPVAGWRLPGPPLSRQRAVASMRKGLSSCRSDEVSASSLASALDSDRMQLLPRGS